MSLPECIICLLPGNFQEIRLFKAVWSLGNGPALTPIVRNKENNLALCDVAVEKNGQNPHVWYSLDLLIEAISLAKIANINQVAIYPVTVAGKPSPLLALYGRVSQTAIVIAPASVPAEDPEEEECDA